ncbi:hypothetical protein CR513_21042, partial [Mucuna pruriens]
MNLVLVLKEDPWWTLYMDGSLNSKGGGTCIILEGLGQVVLEHSLKFDFRTSSNHAEYEALLVRLDLALEVGVRRRLIVGGGTHKSHILRQDNTRADVLSKHATTKTNQHRMIFHKIMLSPTIEEIRVANREVAD